MPNSLLKALKLSTLFYSTTLGFETLADVKNAFQSANIVPDVVGPFDPSALLSALYDVMTETGTIYDAGGALTVEQTVNEPEFWITYNDSSLLQEKFVIAMVDPDAPTPQNRSLSQVRHFIGGDFMISSTQPSGTARLTNSSVALSEYVSPGPPAGSDPHRYTILLFKQSSDFMQKALPLVQSFTAITGFNLSSFASSVGLEDPVAGTFFMEGPANSTIATPSSTNSASMVSALPTAISLNSVQKSFIDSGIVPDVLPSFEPQALLDVAYPDASNPIYVTPGINLTIPQTTNMPSFWLTYTDSSLLNETFVIAMIDPDAPTPQNRSLSQIRHLILGDVHINGSAPIGTAALTNSTPALSDYVSPGPPNGSDPHRYTFLLFKQPANFNQAVSSFVNASTPITNFNITTFASAVGLGDPVAGTFFTEGPFNASAAGGVSTPRGSNAAAGLNSAKVNVALLSFVLALASIATF